MTLLTSFGLIYGVSSVVATNTVMLQHAGTSLNSTHPVLFVSCHCSIFAYTLFTPHTGSSYVSGYNIVTFTPINGFVQSSHCVICHLTFLTGKYSCIAQFTFPDTLIRLIGSNVVMFSGCRKHPFQNNSTL